MPPLENYRTIDGRYTDPVTEGDFGNTNADPSSAAMGSAFGMAVNQYISGELDYHSDLNYQTMSIEVNDAWKYELDNRLLIQEKDIYTAISQNKFRLNAKSWGLQVTGIISAYHDCPRRYTWRVDSCLKTSVFAAFYEDRRITILLRPPEGWRSQIRLHDLPPRFCIDPKFLKIWVLCGYYDLATPFFAAEWVFDHVFLNPEDADRVTFSHYPSGHMIYMHGPSLASFREEALAWYNEQ